MVYWSEEVAPVSFNAVRGRCYIQFADINMRDRLPGVWAVECWDEQLPSMQSIDQNRRFNHKEYSQLKNSLVSTDSSVAPSPTRAACGRTAKSVVYD